MSPPRENVVRVATIPIRGVTTPDAIHAEDGVLVEVEGDGTFTTTATLEEGLNTIEVVVSNFLGSSFSSIVTVIYLP